MKLRIKAQPVSEPTAEVYLEQCGNEISLKCMYPDGYHSSIAFFHMIDKSFHVFDEDMRKLGYTLTHG